MFILIFLDEEIQMIIKSNGLNKNRGTKYLHDAEYPSFDANGIFNSGTFFEREGESVVIYAATKKINLGGQYLLRIELSEVDVGFIKILSEPVTPPSA